VYFGLVACREVVTELDSIARYIQDTLDALLKTAAEHTAAPKPKTPKQPRSTSPAATAVAPSD
jgi:hypothetical protein